jgi:hypothetical protein
VLARLFAAKGLPDDAWWPFLVSGEGKALPGGLESLSGFVLTRDGRVYGWWLDVDAGGEHVLDRWWQVEQPEREFAQDAEFRQARRRLALRPPRG